MNYGGRSQEVANFIFITIRIFHTCFIKSDDEKKKKNERFINHLKYQMGLQHLMVFMYCDSIHAHAYYKSFKAYFPLHL